jgi:hypothetical protein
MSEIKKEIKPNADGSYTITDSHSTADIVRWLLTQDAKETIMYLLGELEPKQEQGEHDKYVMDIECTKCGAKQSGILTVNTTPQPAQKPWVGLTDEEVKKIAYNNIEVKVARAIEAKLREKNT